MVLSYLCNLLTQKYLDTSAENSEEESIVLADIVYEVPYGKNASKEITLSTLTLYSKWRRKVLRAMDLPKSANINLGYIPSWIPQSKKPKAKLVDSADAYSAMLDNILDYIQKQQRAPKNKGKMLQRSYPCC